MNATPRETELWKTPEQGDTLTFPDGRVWTVTATPESGGSRRRISYSFVNAVGASCSASPMYPEWVSRIGRQVRLGAVYERKRSITLRVPVVAELPRRDPPEGTLVALDGEVWVCTEAGWTTAKVAEDDA